MKVSPAAIAIGVVLLVIAAFGIYKVTNKPVAETAKKEDAPEYVKEMMKKGDGTPNGAPSYGQGYADGNRKAKFGR